MISADHQLIDLTSTRFARCIRGDGNQTVLYEGHIQASRELEGYVSNER